VSKTVRDRRLSVGSEQDSLPLSFQERYPHLEEAYWFGEGVIPDLAARGLLPGTAVGPGAPLLVASGR
jgi:hypothetical protein